MSLTIRKRNLREMYKGRSDQRAKIYAQRRALTAFPMNPRPFAAPAGLFNARNRSKREFKFNDTSVQVLAMAGISSWTQILCNGIGTGTDYNSRIGRRLTIKSILVKVTNYNYTLGTNIGHPFQQRVIILRDRQPNGVAFTPGELLQNVTSTPVALTSPPNINNQPRFHILADELMTVQMHGSISEGRGYYKFYKRVNIPVQYNGTGPTIGSIADNAIYVISFSNDDNEAVFYTRVRFTDD